MKPDKDDAANARNCGDARIGKRSSSNAPTRFDDFSEKARSDIDTKTVKSNGSVTGDSGSSTDSRSRSIKAESETMHTSQAATDGSFASQNPEVAKSAPKNAEVSDNPVSAAVATSAVPVATNGTIAEVMEPTGPTPDFLKFRPSEALLKRREWKSRIMAGVIALAFVIAMVPLISLLWTTIARGVKRLNLNFLTFNMSGVIGGMPTPTGGHGGIEHAIIGTLEVTLGAMLISVPVGLMCAIYLTEYARGSKFGKAISMLVNVMSGIPSIVAGLFAFSLFAILMGPGVSNGFEGSVALSILMIPTVVNSSVEMLRIVPDDLREASYALGVTKSRTIVRIVLRTALPGIVSGVILAIARVIGETAPLLMTAGFIVTTNWNLFSGQMTTLPVFVYQEYSKMSVTCPPDAGPGCVASIPSERSWAAALVLIVIVLVLNLVGRLIQRLFSVEVK